MSVLLELCLFPIGEGRSVKPYVARAVKIIADSGLRYRLGAMGTTIEGEWDEVQQVVTDCFRALEQDCDRVYMITKIDAVKGRENALEYKPAAVEKFISDNL